MSWAAGAYRRSEERSTATTDPAERSIPVCELELTAPDPRLRREDGGCSRPAVAEMRSAPMGSPLLPQMCLAVLTTSERVQSRRRVMGPERQLRPVGAGLPSIPIPAGAERRRWIQAGHRRRPGEALLSASPAGAPAR